MRSSRPCGKAVPTPLGLESLGGEINFHVGDQCVSGRPVGRWCVNRGLFPQSHMYLYRQPVGDFRVKVCE